MFKSVAEGVIVSLHVQPNSKKNELIGELNSSLKIKIKAPPVDGKANLEIVSFLSELLGVPKSRIEVLKGSKSKIKKVLVRGTTELQLQNILTHSNISK